MAENPVEALAVAWREALEDEIEHVRRFYPPGEDPALHTRNIDVSARAMTKLEAGGYRLVHRDADKCQIDAGLSAMCDGGDIEDVFRAMLDAAPGVKEEEEGKGG